MKHLAGYLVVICLILFGCGSEGENNGAPASDRNLTEQENFSVATFVIHFPDSTPHTFTYDFSESTLLGAPMTSPPQLRVSMKEYAGMGRLVTGINGFDNSENGDRYWQFCVNGTVSAKGIDQIELSDGDQIDWHFVPYNTLPCKKIGE